MDLLNIHTHRAAEANECVVRSYDLCKECCSPGQLQGNYFSVGFHPWSLHSRMDLSVSLNLLQEVLSLPGACMLGECGLDKCCQTDFELQLRFFQAQADLAEKMKMPVILHCVRSFDVLLSVRRSGSFRQPWIIHGFRGKAALMEQLLHSGFYFSFGSFFQEEALRRCPEGRFFIETDESRETVLSVYRRIACIRNISLDYLASLQQKQFAVLCRRSQSL